VVKRLFLLTFSALAVWAASPEFDRARTLYNLTDFEQSIKVLQSAPVKDAAVQALIGRDYYMLGDYRRATEALQKAVAADPASSEYALWLGRAFGRRAETSTVLTAPGHASKAREFFEKAVQLDPRNLEALSDLFEYYLEAPGFLGGGIEKARGLVPRIAALSPSEGYWAESRVSQKGKEYRDAEEQLRRAIDAAPQQVGKLVELAKFLAGQGRIHEADQSLARAETIAPGSPKLMYARAELYIRTNRNRDQARELLQRYLDSHLTPDDPPRADALKLLKQVRGG
jgi:tetratricopeptide (TPR) repeat protein